MAGLDLFNAALKGAKPGASEDPAAAKARLERRIERERQARQQAEALLEKKSLELFNANEALKALNAKLEETVADRTGDLEKALDDVRAEKSRCEHQALHDPLTALPNRRYLRLRLDEMVAIAREHDLVLGVLHVDLDRFKQINDTMGHPAGDYVLTHVAKELKALARAEDFVARIGGDEFVVVTLVAEPNGENAVLSERITETFGKPLPYSGSMLRFGASVGVAEARGAEIDPGDLLINADIALYRAKDAGRGVVATFTPELQIEMNRRKELADQVIEGLERGEFIPFYHPRICAKTRRISSVEALARWRHKDKGMLSPFRFLDVARDVGYEAELDKAILLRAIADFRRWEAAGVDAPDVSVNVSYKRLMDDQLLEELSQMDFPRGRLNFEILETMYLDEADRATLDRIDALKAMGVGIEIDDFGSGHASILSVIKLQPKAIKIDRALLSELPKSQVQAKLIKAIIDIGRSLDVEVVAEGVETEAHIDCCIDLGVDSLQGFAFAKPMPVEEMTKMLGSSRS